MKVLHKSLQMRLMDFNVGANMPYVVLNFRLPAVMDFDSQNHTVERSPFSRNDVTQCMPVIIVNQRAQ